jgi:hypothetical protein
VSPRIGKTRQYSKICHSRGSAPHERMEPASRGEDRISGHLAARIDCRCVTLVVAGQRAKISCGLPGFG